MNVTNARYTSPDNNTIDATVNGVAYTGIHPGVWLWGIVNSSGVTIAPYQEPETPAVSVPTIVTMRQARIAMSRAGLLTQVEAALASMTGQAGVEARIEWEYALTFERNHPLVQNLSAALGLSETTLDNLFLTASTI